MKIPRCVHPASRLLLGSIVWLGLSAAVSRHGHCLQAAEAAPEAASPASFEEALLDLDSVRRETREAALKRLAVPAAVRFAPVVAALLDSADSMDVANAVATLAAMQAREYTGRIAALTVPPDLPVRRAVMDALAHLNDNRCVDAAVAVLTLEFRYDYDNTWKEKALTLLRQGPRTPADSSRIAELLKSTEDREQQAALQALGAMRARDQAATVADLIPAGADAETRKLAISTLREMNAAEQSPKIAGVLRDAELLKKADSGDSKSGELVSEAMVTLGEWKAVDYAPDLQRLKGMPDGGPLRAWAAEALFLMGRASRAETGRFLGELLSASRPRSWYSSSYVLPVLIRLKAPEGTGYLLRELGDASTEDSGWKRELVFALKALRFSCDREQVLWFLYSDMPEAVRAGTLTALLELKTGEYEADVLPLLEAGESPAVRVAAIRMLEGCGTIKAAEPNLNLVRAEGPEAVRVAALRAFVRLKKRPATAEIIELLTHPGPASLRATALDLLKPPALNLPEQEDGEASAPVIWACLRREEPYIVRRSALELLERGAWPSSAPALTELLAAGEPERLRGIAMAALTRIGGGQMEETVRSTAVQRTTALLNESGMHAPVREALELLKTMARDEEFGPLLSLLEKREHRELTLETLETLKRWQSPKVVEAIARLLSEEKDSWTRAQIIDVLQAIRIPERASALTRCLTMEEETYVVVKALDALGEVRPVTHADTVAGMLRRENAEIRSAALRALGSMEAKAAGPAIVAILPALEKTALAEAVDALGRIKAFEEMAAAPDYIHAQDVMVRAAAAGALGRCGGGRYRRELIAFFTDKEEVVRRAAVRGAGALHNADGAAILRTLLLSEYSEVRQGAAQELKQFPAEAAGEDGSIFVEAAARYPGLREEALAAGVAGVRDEAVMAALRYLAGGGEALRPMTVAESERLLDGFRRLQRDAARYSFPTVPEECARAIAAVVQAGMWNTGDARRLEALADEVEGFATHLKAVEIRAVAAELRQRDPVRRAIRTALWLMVLQPIAWALILFVYPWSRLAQAMVWSHRARRWLGFGWVGPLVINVRPLRNWLWRPFREALVPPGEVVSFDEWTFFDAVRVRDPAGGDPQPALRVLADRRGVAMLSGESGLGKTTLLQALTGLTDRPVALLRAVECSGGLLEALIARLPEHVRSRSRPRRGTEFLRAVVRRGSPDIFVDAVHEALPEVRARLTEEVNALPGARVLLTTQPVEWELPRGAAEWRLEPLRAQDMAPFLLKQGTAAVEAAGEGSPAERQRAFAARTAQFLNHLDALPPESAEAVALRRMLGNPMEAVLAAELLAAGQTPDPDRLLEQRMEHLEDDYAAQCGDKFPATAFASHLRHWRASGAPLLKLEDVFAGVASFLARHRLLRKSADGAEAWRFRHDKIMEWFLGKA